MVIDEKQLAQAIMRGDSRIELDLSLVTGVEKILAPSSTVWESIFAVFISAAFFGFAAIFAFPVVLAICGGVGGIVFVTLGAQGLMCAYRLMSAAKTADVLNMLRDNYDIDRTYNDNADLESAVLIHL